MNLSPRERQTLFMELAQRPGGTTGQDAYQAGLAQGDGVSEEAYFNLGRRLTHAGKLKSEKVNGRTVYTAKFDNNATWLDESHIASIIDPEYPLPALTAYRESLRQVRDIPEAVWIEVRARLSEIEARTLFLDAIISYADNLYCEIADFASERARASNAPYLPNLRHRAESSLALLVSLCKDGLGLSDEAISLPITLDLAVEAMSQVNGPTQFYDRSRLSSEIHQRVEPGPFIRPTDTPKVDSNLTVAGVDGSSVGGLLSLDGTGGDFSFGHAPQVSVNTATGVINRDIRMQNRDIPAFLRLPERPEDMQRQDNRYTIMAKMFFPDLTDSQYVHSTWNAMDLLECRTTLSMQTRWAYLPGNFEMPPADVVLRDGTIVPNDRDHIHYGQQNTYGRIVRDLIDASWKIAKNCREDGQTVVGVVKNAQLQVLSPVINYFLTQVAASSSSTQLSAWPLEDMNQLFDQALISRILTAGRREDDPWLRTVLVLRPFHATSNLGKRYSCRLGRKPYEKLLEKAERAKAKEIAELTEDEAWWRELRTNGDPYVQMLKNVWYPSFYLGAFKHLDSSEMLPRLEFLLPHCTEETGEFPTDLCGEHLHRTLSALSTVGFQVDKEHAMFDASDRIDLLPAILIRSHEIVKTWAKELKDRVVEFMDWHLAKYLSASQKRQVSIRPWTRAELEAWVDSMQNERKTKGPQ